MKSQVSGLVLALVDGARRAFCKHLANVIEKVLAWPVD